MNTVSIEVAKELYELGWRKKCLFSSLKGGEAYCNTMDDNEILNICEDYFYMPQFHEIIELLPKLPYQGITADPLASQDVIFAKTESGYAIRFTQSDIFVNKTNPHDAAAKLLIWAIKNKFVTL